MSIVAGNLTDQIWLDPKSIQVPSGRQRSHLELDESLVQSIKLRGIINPIVVTRDGLQLVAGGRRLSAALMLELQSVPCRWFESLDEVELLEIELDENAKRKDLSWQDSVRAIAEIHRKLCALNPGWTMARTATRLGVSAFSITRYLRVASELYNPKISSCPQFAMAYNLLARKDSRTLEETLTEISEAGEELFTTPSASTSGSATHPGVPPSTSSVGLTPTPATTPATVPTPVAASAPTPVGTLASAPVPVLHENFLSWARVYSGPKFNFIHCDFPYGIQAFYGGSNAQHSDVGYADSPDLYWQLLHCLCTNLDRLMLPSAHLLLWFSMKNYTATVEFLRRHAPQLEVDPFPLVWLKSCNTGMVPDSNRSPRRVYETALVASREDRKIIRPLANAYAAPTNSSRTHPSEKPVPVLRHFFAMYVDETTRLLDPTCGSGSALEAAESLGAKHVLGIEKNPEHHKTAVQNLRAFRALRKGTTGK